MGVSGADRKICISGSLFSITWQASWGMPNSDPRDEFFYLRLTPMKDSYITVQWMHQEFVNLIWPSYDDVLLHKIQNQS